jgi:hypothetical protein
MNDNTINSNDPSDKVKCKIKQTTDFWIDNGILALYFILEKLNTEEQRKNYSLNEFTSKISDDGSCLEIETDNYGEIEKLMNIAREVSTDKLVEETKNDNYVWDNNRKEIITVKRKNWKWAFKGFYKGKIGVGIHYKSKKKSTEQQLVTAEIEKCLQKRTDFKDSEKVWIEGPKFEVGNVFDIKYFDKQKKTKNCKKPKGQCVISNEPYKELSNMKTWNFPFITDTGGLNYFSNLTGKIEISKLYSFISIFSPLQTFYSLVTLGNAPKKRTIACYFILQDDNLNSLRHWSEDMKYNLHLSGDKSCNYKKPTLTIKGNPKILQTVYFYENEISFLYSIYRYTYKELQRDYRNQLLTKKIISFTEEETIYRDIKIFTKIEPLFNLFEKTSNDDMFLEMFMSFYDKNNKLSIWRNKLSKLILDFKNIVLLLEEYYGSVCLRDNYVNYYLVVFLEIYLKECKIMNHILIETCKKYGGLIGHKCFETKDKGILYSLRNTKNRIDFLKTLSDIQFKLEINFEEQFFKDLPDSSEWIETKSLLTIFAMNSFLYKTNKEKQKNDTEQQSN